MAQTICFALWVLLSVALCRGGTEFWSIRHGDICNVTASFPRPSDKDVEFFECLKPTNDVNAWPWLEIGIWQRSRCFIEDQVFDASYKTCRSKKSVRRQQSICAQQPMSPYFQPACQGQQCNVQVQVQQQYVQPVIQPQPQQQCCQQQPIIQPVQPPCQPCMQQPCPQQPVCPQPILPTLPPQQPCPQQCVQPTPVVPMPCPLAQGQGSQGAQVGGICSWMLAPLAADPSTTCGFLQCVPRQPGQYCGVWVKMPCAPATRFDVNVQVCVWDEMRQCGGMQQQCCPTPVAPTQAPCTPCPMVQQPCVQQPCQPQILPTMPIIQPSCTAGTLPIAPCNQQQQCPGFSSCQTQSNVCCQPVFGG